MNQDRHRQIMRILDEVIDCDPERREEILSGACQSDEQLRREVLKLLEHNTAAGTFLDESPFEVIPGLYEEASIVGQHIGHYRITEEIGRGGMGTVYKAVRDDDQYQTTVAIKLIKRGMDSEVILRRFRMERQILANLNHPNIASLLDGGVTEMGQPYFVMEYIDGKPINKFCDERRLSTTERLKLFRTVCKPVQYPHQNLVVHRDIKPSNIVVTEDGEPKLLDFGIAKLLHSESSGHTQTELTATELRVMTPEYASPEQVKGESITTASDVYSLGVLLYELLTGHRPYRFKSHLPDEVARVISEIEPEKPSTAISRVEETSETDGSAAVHVSPKIVSETREGAPEKLRRRLRGDIDNIVLMALRKEPQRRYSSVEHFSEDIRRHLEGLPVVAQKDTLRYRAQKFVQRNRAGVVAASLVFLALLVGMTVAIWQARVARAERAKAERRFNDVRRIANLFMFDYHDAIATLPGATPVRQRLVKDALEYLDALSKEAGDDRSLQRDVATAYMKIGDIQGGTVESANKSTVVTANLGDRDGARESYRKAVEIRERLVALEPNNRELRHELALTYDHLGDLVVLQGKPVEAFEYQRKAIAIYEDLLSADPSNKVLLSTLSVLYGVAASTQYAPSAPHLGNLQEAINYQRKGLAISLRVAAADPANPDNRQILAAQYVNLGSSLMLRGNYEEGLDNQRKGAAITEGLVKEFNTNLIYQRELAVQYGNIGRTLLLMDDKAGAMEKFTQSKQLLESVVAADPSNPDFRRVLATAHRNMAEGLTATGDHNGALGNLNKSAQLLSELRAKDEKNARLKSLLGVTYLKISTVLSNKGDIEGAIAKAREAVELVEPLVAASPNDSSARQTLASSYAELSKGYASMANRASTPIAKQKEYWLEASNGYRKSLNLWQEIKTKGTLSAADADKAAEVKRELARCDEALRSYSISL